MIANTKGAKILKKLIDKSLKSQLDRKPESALGILESAKSTLSGILTPATGKKINYPRIAGKVYGTMKVEAKDMIKFLGGK
jgi:hypothetical protein